MRRAAGDAGHRGGLVVFHFCDCVVAGAVIALHVERAKSI